MNPLDNRTVMLVEDEWLVRMELVQAFEDEGCAVCESGSAEDAFILLGTTENLDLLVTDIRLAGGMDGWRLAIAARERWPSLAVIYLSANPPMPDFHVPGGVFIDKPALMDSVVVAARKLVASI